MPKDPDSLVELCRARSESEASIIAAVLRDEGIPAQASDAGADVFGGAMDAIIPRRVRVRRADLDRARAVLEQRAAESGDIDWDDVDWAAEDDPEREDPSAEPIRTAVDRALLVRVTAFLLIVVILLFLLTSIFSPGGTDGVVPGGP
ncbi:MAG: putative signal transducing protein [Phycisphaerales bacterium JB040]